MNKNQEARLTVKNTHDYLLFHFGKKKTYLGFDKNEQKRWRRYCKFEDRYNEGVYNDCNSYDE